MNSNRPNQQYIRSQLLIKANEALILAAGLITKAMADTNGEEWVSPMLAQQITTVRNFVNSASQDGDLLDDGETEYPNEWWVAAAFELADTDDLMDGAKVSEVQGQWYDESEDE